MLMSKQALVLQTGEAPAKILVLHDDGSVSRVEVNVPHTGAVQVRFTIAEGQQFDIEGCPRG